ncbi:MAG: hydroxymethylpyrimidine/phosphomethylpyrimidine kinase [Alphaproteobacteria bacterium]|nr:hydroxymethylpyrimidine/phosphomethylpyrimidine kinase [Alphaproteobacteria bacterium]
MTGRVLLLGEFIASGGIGLQGDIITVTALGGHALSIPTCLSTSIIPGKRQSCTIDPNFIREQFKSCMENPGVNCIKIGAIPSLDVLNMVSESLKALNTSAPVVLNPILTSEAGEYLLGVDAIQNYKLALLNKTDLLVVNIRDAELLSGHEIFDVQSMCEAAKKLYAMGPKAVLITGGLLSGNEFHDVLMTDAGEEVLSIKKNHVHNAQVYRFGGGWVLSTAIAVSLAQNFDLKNAINRARQFVDKAIGTSFNSDESYQCLNLAHTIHPFVHDNVSHVYKIIPGSKFKSP